MIVFAQKNRIIMSSMVDIFNPSMTMSMAKQAIVNPTIIKVNNGLQRLLYQMPYHKAQSDCKHST